MNEQKISNESIALFKNHLINEEKSNLTIEKYMHDLNVFFDFCKNKTITKSMVLEYKQHLAANYKVSATNSMLAAVNSYFKFMGWEDYRVKQFKMQKKSFCNENEELTRDEYLRLVRTAEAERNIRLSLVLQTICGTGIRVSELKYITADSVRAGEFTVSCKNKTRKVFIVKGLQKKLLSYMKQMGINKGMVFATKNGKPLNRSNLWRAMKRLCEKANVLTQKVFPHNLRHLFARTFYKIEKDIAKLADILGHSSIDTTRIYIVTTGKEHRRQLETMHLII